MDYEAEVVTCSPLLRDWALQAELSSGKAITAPEIGMIKPVSTGSLGGFVFFSFPSFYGD